MGELGRHLDNRQKQGSVILPAAVVSNRPDGNVYVRIRHTGKIVVASRGNSGGTYTPGQVVQVSRTDASGVTSNTGWVIIGPPPTNMKGSSQSVPLEESATKTAATVTHIAPNPVLLAASDVATVILYGVFTETPALAYGSVDLSDDIAPAVTPAQITLQVRASVAAANGEHDLLINGVVAAPDLFHVTAATSPAHSLWALVYNDGYATQALVRIDAAAMSLFHQYDLGGFVGETYITNKGGVIYAKCGPQFIKVNAATGAMLDPVPCTNSNNDELQLADVGNLLFYGGDVFGSPNQLLMFDASSDTEGGWALTITGTPTYPTQTALDWDGLFLWLAGGTLVRWEIATASVVGEFAIAINAVAIDENAIFTSSGGAMQKYDSTPVNPTTLNLLASTSLGSGFMNAQHKMRVVSGYLYATIGGTETLTRFDRSTLAVLADVAIGHTVTEFEFASGIFYVGDWDGGITRVDAATMAIIDRTVFAANDAACLVYV